MSDPIAERDAAYTDGFRAGQDIVFASIPPEAREAIAAYCESVAAFMSVSFDHPDAKAVEAEMRAAEMLVTRIPRDTLLSIASALRGDPGSGGSERA